MPNLSIGKLRGLQQISSQRGTFTVLALDHRNNLRRALNPQDPSAVSDGDLTRFKLETTAALASEATAVLLDPEYSAAPAVAAGMIPNGTGLVVALESTGYSGEATARQARILPGWSVEKAKRMGASAIKLLVYYHPDSSTAEEIESFVRQVAGDCIKHDLVLILEPLSYSLDEKKKLSSREKHQVVIETAKRLTSLGVDILKAEFPLDASTSPGAEADQNVWKEACAEISSASSIPWILLSAAVDYETYLQQVTAACNAGASGIAVGRAVWQEAVTMQGEARIRFLRTTGKDRLSRLTSLCATLAKPFTDFYKADVPGGWYKTY